MGIDTRAVIVIAVPYDELNSELQRTLESDGEISDFQSFSPYYDCPHEDALHGVEVFATDDYTWGEIPADFADLVAKAKTSFKEIAGVEGRLYLSPYVW